MGTRILIRTRTKGSAREGHICMEKVMSVFPQGGVPRPELFLLYINGFPNTIECLTNLFFFANATKIYTDINLQTKKNII